MNGMLQPDPWVGEALCSTPQVSSARRCRNAAIARSSTSSTAWPSCGRRSSSRRVWVLMNPRTCPSASPSRQRIQAAVLFPTARRAHLGQCDVARHRRGERTAGEIHDEVQGACVAAQQLEGEQAALEKPIAPTTGALCAAIQCSIAAAEASTDAGSAGSTGISNQA